MTASSLILSYIRVFQKENGLLDGSKDNRNFPRREYDTGMDTMNHVKLSSSNGDTAHCSSFISSGS